MKKFIIKLFWLSLPFIALHLFTSCFYTSTQGDLLRIGYIYNAYPDYRNQFKEEFNQKLNFEFFIQKKENISYKIFTVGDSFSNQMQIGYQNYIEQEKYGRVLNLGIISNKKNQIQTLSSLSQSNFFNDHQFNYVIIQCVERSFVERSLVVNNSNTLEAKQLLSLLKKNKKVKQKNDFISQADLIFPYNYIKDIITKNKYGCKEKLCKEKLTNSKFTVEKDEILFLKKDVEHLENSNKTENIQIVNEQLNIISKSLNEKGIKLIVLPAPDKYSVYYPYIKDKETYIKPQFLDVLATLEKDYLYLDSKKVLSQAIKTQKDIYFYDDTHWSPWASKIIAKEIEQIIDEDKQQKKPTTTPQ